MDVWKYEQTDFTPPYFDHIPEWRRELYGAGNEQTRDMWAVSVRGFVFTGFETRKDAREYGKRVKANFEKGVLYAEDIAQLPLTLASFYRTAALEAGYFYNPTAGGWVNNFAFSHASGELQNAKIYESAREVVWHHVLGLVGPSAGMELEGLLEMLEYNLEEILANVRKAHPDLVLRAAADDWRPQDTHSTPQLLGSSCPPPTS